MLDSCSCEILSFQHIVHLCKSYGRLGLQASRVSQAGHWLAGLGSLAPSMHGTASMQKKRLCSQHCVPQEAINDNLEGGLKGTWIIDLQNLTVETDEAGQPNELGAGGFGKVKRPCAQPRSLCRAMCVAMLLASHLQGLKTELSSWLEDMHSLSKTCKRASRMHGHSECCQPLHKPLHA